MYKRVTVSIHINDSIRSSFCEGFNIYSDWRNVGDTASISMPSNMYYKNVKADNLFKVGNKISIFAGYNEQNILRFKGFIKSVKPGTPLFIECEDNAYTLPRRLNSKSFNKVKLSEFIAYIAPNVKSVLIDSDINLGNLLIENISSKDAFRFLADEFSLFAWFRNDTLFVGFPYTQRLKDFKFNFQQNIRSLPSDLDFSFDDSERVTIKAIANKKGGKKSFKIFPPDGKGAERTINFGDVGDDFLLKAAKAEFQKSRTNQREGTFNLFGSPVVEHGDIIEYSNKEYPTFTERRLIDSVTTILDSNSLYQKLDLGPQA